MLNSDNRIIWIDIIRTLAILMVVALHIGIELTHEQWLRTIGNIGESLFFIASGFILAYRYPNTKDFSFSWFAKRYVSIASLYYPTLLAIALLFPEDKGTLQTLYDLLLHYTFINWAIPDHLYTMIGSAWFLIPLMAFYLLYPYLNMLLIRFNYLLPLVFTISTISRYMDLPSTSPVFFIVSFLCDFCFGIAFAHNRSSPFLISSILAGIPHPSMLIPYLISYLFSALEERNVPGRSLFQSIGANTFQIFLFHEPVMYVLLGNRQVWDLGFILSLSILIFSLLVVEDVHKDIRGFMEGFINHVLNRHQL